MTKEEWIDAWDNMQVVSMSRVLSEIKPTEQSLINEVKKYMLLELHSEANSKNFAIIETPKFKFRVNDFGTEIKIEALAVRIFG